MKRILLIYGVHYCDSDLQYTYFENKKALCDFIDDEKNGVDSVLECVYVQHWYEVVPVEKVLKHAIQLRKN